MPLKTGLAKIGNSRSSGGFRIVLDDLLAYRLQADGVAVLCSSPEAFAPVAQLDRASVS